MQVAPQYNRLENSGKMIGNEQNYSSSPALAKSYLGPLDWEKKDPFTQPNLEFLHFETKLQLI